MNHYECLKVTPDAPTEVIRAAYRALAGKRHPDRQGHTTGQDDVGHKEMVAINAAYEVLINPVLRAEYDALLAAKTANGGGGSKAPRAVDAAPEAATGFSETRIDIDWLSPKGSRAVPLWPLTGTRRHIAIGLLVLAVFTTIWVAWQVVTQHQMDKALSEQYAARPAAPASSDAVPELPSPSSRPGSKVEAEALARADSLLEEDAAAIASRPAARGASAASGSTAKPPVRSEHQVALDHLPTVTELSQMSDEQLMAVLPSLGELQPAKGSFSRQAAANARHPLDGKPLNLRSDTQLVDPLAQP